MVLYYKYAVQNNFLFFKLIFLFSDNKFLYWVYGKIFYLLWPSPFRMFSEYITVRHPTPNIVYKKNSINLSGYINHKIAILMFRPWHRLKFNGAKFADCNDQSGSVTFQRIIALIYQEIYGSNTKTKICNQTFKMYTNMLRFISWQDNKTA